MGLETQPEFRTIGCTLCVLLWLCSSRWPPAREIRLRSLLSMRTHWLLERVLCSRGYRNRIRSWWWLFLPQRNSFHRSLGRLTGRCAAAAVSLATGSWMKGCGRLSHPSPLQTLQNSHPSPLQPLQNSFCLHYGYDADASSIILLLNAWLACYNTGNKSTRGSFDPPTQVTINTIHTHSLLWVAADEVSMLRSDAHLSLCICHMNRLGTGLEYLVHAQTDCARHTHGSTYICCTGNWWAGPFYLLVVSPTRSLRVSKGLATLLDNMRESIHIPYFNSGASKLHRASASRGKPVLICILARSLGFHAVTPERNSFRENPTYFSTYTRRWTRGIVCGAIHGSWREFGCGQTKTQDNYSNPCCTCAPRVNYHKHTLMAKVDELSNSNYAIKRGLTRNRRAI